jgi:hypothetical protein
MLDSGWCDWDLAVSCASGLMLRVATDQEEHGEGRRLIRIRYRLGPTASMNVVGTMTLVGLTIAAWCYPTAAMAGGALMLGFVARAWARGRSAATRVMALFHTQAHRMQMIPCEEGAPPRFAPERHRERLDRPLNPRASAHRDPHGRET